MKVRDLLNMITVNYQEELLSAYAKEKSSGGIVCSDLAIKIKRQRVEARTKNS